MSEQNHDPFRERLTARKHGPIDSQIRRLTRALVRDIINRSRSHIPGAYGDGELHRRACNAVINFAATLAGALERDHIERLAEESREAQGLKGRGNSQW